MQKELEVHSPQGQAFAFEDNNNQFYFVSDAYVDLPIEMCVLEIEFIINFLNILNII
jgi:hypothetical protein